MARATKDTRKENMGGLAKGLSIIESFSPVKPKLSVSEAAVAGNMSPAAARRCLLTLQELGFVAYDGKYFQPTPRMSRLALGYTSTSLPTLAQTHLDAVRDQTERSASLAVLEDGYALFVARAEVQNLVSATVRLGSRLPAQTSSNGRILLAALDDDALEHGLRNLHPAISARGKMVRDKAAVRKRVLEARKRGYSYSDEELEYGVRTLAVPVRDARGVTHAAMSISAFAQETSIKNLIDKNLNILQRAAQSLGSML
jgi:IclR family pca regulon transcriptional regulator